MKYWHIWIKGLGMYLPKGIKEDLDIFIDDMMNSEMDMVLCIDGKEGTGKSRTGRIIGKYIAHKTKTQFDEKNIHFTTDDYIKFSESSKRFTVNILDESRMALNKKRSMGKTNLRFTNWLSENRDKQQVHILILPAIHDLDNYIANWRMSLLVNCRSFHKPDKTTASGYKLERGYVKIFEKNKELQQVMHNKAKFGYYAYPYKCKYLVKFKDQEPFTPEQLKRYKDKKAKIRQEKYAEDATNYNQSDIQKLKANNKLKIEGKTQTERGQYFGVDRTTISKWDKIPVECDT